jgi:hypothetical protein
MADERGVEIVRFAQVGLGPGEVAPHVVDDPEVTAQDR